MLHPEIGRKLYLESIEKSKHSNNQPLNWVAILNYAREEIKIGSEYIDLVMDAVSKIPKESKNKEVTVLRNDILEAYTKHKEQNL